MTTKQSFKYAVYLASVGKTKAPAIVRANVSVADGLAFVRRSVGSRTADVLPEANVFDTREDANAYMAGDGVPRWVVASRHDLGDWKGSRVPAMFEAFVKYYNYEHNSGGRSGSEYSATVKRLSDGSVSSLSRLYGDSVFETRKEAERAFAKRWAECSKEVDKEACSATLARAELDKSKPKRRAGARGPAVSGRKTKQRG